MFVELPTLSVRIFHVEDRTLALSVSEVRAGVKFSLSQLKSVSLTIFECLSLTGWVTGAENQHCYSPLKMWEVCWTTRNSKKLWATCKIVEQLLLVFKRHGEKVTINWNYTVSQYFSTDFNTRYVTSEPEDTPPWWFLDFLVSQKFVYSVFSRGWRRNESTSHVP